MLICNGRFSLTHKPTEDVGALYNLRSLQFYVLFDILHILLEIKSILF